MNVQSPSLPMLLEHSVAEYPERAALVAGRARLTYWQLQQEVERLAAGLATLGVHRGSTVALRLESSPQLVVGYYAILALGARVLIGDPRIDEAETERQWAEADCTHAIVSAEEYETCADRSWSGVPIEHFVLVSGSEYLQFPLNVLARLKDQHSPGSLDDAHGNIHFLRELAGTHELGIGPAGTEREAMIQSEEIAVLAHTRGTTNPPKGVMLTHGNLVASARQLRTKLSMLEAGQEVWLAGCPIYQAFGMTAALNLPLSMGATLVFAPDALEGRELLRAAARHRATVLCARAGQLESLSEPDLDELNLEGLKLAVSGLQPLTAAARKSLETLCSEGVVETFGPTEACGLTHCRGPGDTAGPDSIGLALPETEARVLDPRDGKTLPAQHLGELAIRGPQVMRGYSGPAGADDPLPKGSWLQTGDMVATDEQGRFFFFGRKEDLIVSDGQEIYPDEIDQALRSHPAVRDAATIGVPDSARGEAVVSFVVLQSEQRATESVLLDYLAQRLASYKVPRRVKFARDLPRNADGEILRSELRRRESAGAGAEPTGPSPQRAATATLR